MKTHLSALIPFLWIALITVSFGLTVHGQTPVAKTAEKVISGGIVNGKAKSLPKPVYPESARIAKIAGQVNVEVVIDQTGKVIEAKTVSGVEDLALRQASEAAALQAEFAPTLLSGEPVKVRGVITYNFVAPDKVQNEGLRFKLMAATVLLTAAKSFANDAELLRRSFDGKDVLAEMIADFPEYAAELREVRSFERLTPEKRISSIDTAIAAIRAKVTEPLKWQIDVGIQLGEMTGPMALRNDKGAKPIDSKGLDEAAIKLNLSKIAVLAAKPPADFPNDALAKLVAVGELAKKESLTSFNDFAEYRQRVGAFIEAMSREDQ